MVAHGHVLLFQFQLSAMVAHGHVMMVMLLLQFQLFCLRLWNPDLFTGRATCPRTAVFSLYRTCCL
jgi:hypothetical protein